MKIFKTLSIALILWGLAFVGAGQAATFYVRPLGGSYGLEDGSSYVNAYDGFADINWTAVGGNNTLFVCGTHAERLLIGASGADYTHRLNIMSCTTANGASVNDPGVITATLSNYQGAIQTSKKNYITIDGLSLLNNNGTGSENHGVRLYGGLGITLRNMTINGNDGDGLYVDCDPENCDVDDFILEYSDIKGNKMSGILIGNVKTTATIRYNNFNGNGTSSDTSKCYPGDTGRAYYHNIYIAHVQNGGTNYVYGNRLEDDLCGQGIKIKHNAQVYYNYIAGNLLSGIMHIEYEGVTATQIAHHNVIIGNPFFQIQVLLEGNGTLTVYDYNNSLYSTTVGHSWTSGVEFELTSPGPFDTYIAKNNIIYSPATRHCWRSHSGAVPTSTTIKNNWCYGPSGNIAVWAGTERSWSYWRNTLGFDYPVGGNADPKYTNPGSNDLTLQASSPCIDAGENLGTAYQMALSPSTTWTLKNPGIVESSVVTMNQNSYGTGWEMGAYVYDGSGPSLTPPTNLRVIP